MNFSLKGQAVNIFSFVHHGVSVTTTQVKAATDNVQTNETLVIQTGSPLDKAHGVQFAGPWPWITTAGKAPLTLPDVGPRLLGMTPSRRTRGQHRAQVEPLRCFPFLTWIWRLPARRIPRKKDFFLWIHSKGKANGLGKGLSLEEAGDGDGNKRGIPWPCHLPLAATQSLLQPWPSQGHPASPRCPGRGSVPQGCLGRCLFGAVVSSSSAGLVGPLQVSFSVWGPALLLPVF